MSAKTTADPDPAAAESQAPEPPSPLLAAFGGLSLRVRLLLLLAIAILPAVVAGVATALTRYEAGLNETRASLRSLSVLAVNRQLETLAETSRLLQTLAKVPEVAALDSSRCSAELARQYQELSQRYTNIAVVDARGEMRCSALPMEPGRKYSNPEQIKDTLARRTFVVSGIAVGGFSGERLLSAAAPVVNARGQTVGAIVTGIKATFLDRQFDSYRLPQGSQLALVDRTGTPLIESGGDTWRLPEAGAIVGALASGELELQHRVEGRPHLVVLNPIGDYDVYVLAALPDEEATSPVTTRLMTDIGEILAFTLLSAIGVLVGAQLLVLAPIARFRRAVRAYRSDPASFAFDSAAAPAEIAELASEFATMARDVDARQENMKALLRQRDLLVRETNHRVKNNLQIVASLLSLQSRRIAEPTAKRQFDLARQRVATLALLHRHLYEQRDTETVNLRAFFGQLMNQLLSAYGQRAHASVSVADIRVPPSVAIPLGLIVTEAVTNAMKYAFPTGRNGRIDLLVTVENGRGMLVLQDDGVGLPDAGDEKSGMGDILMRGFAEQVSGTLAVETAEGGGTRVVLDFDPGEPPERPDPPDDETIIPG